MPKKGFPFVRRRKPAYPAVGPFRMDREEIAASQDPQVYRDTEDALREVLQQAMQDAKNADWRYGGPNRPWGQPVRPGWDKSFPPSPHTPPGWPLVSPPPGWGTYEPVGPGSDLAQMVRRLETIAPGIRGLSSNIGAGPDKDLMRVLFNQGSPEYLGSGRTPLANMDLRGQRGIESENIHINPFLLASGATVAGGQRSPEMFGTTAHELSHGTHRGWGDDHPEANIVGSLAEMLAGGLSAPPASLRRAPPRTQEAVTSQLDTLFGGKPWYRRGQ